MPSYYTRASEPICILAYRHTRDCSILLEWRTDISLQTMLMLLHNKIIAVWTDYVKYNNASQTCGHVLWLLSCLLHCFVCLQIITIEQNFLSINMQVLKSFKILAIIAYNNSNLSTWFLFATRSTTVADKTRDAPYNGVIIHDAAVSSTCSCSRFASRTDTISSTSPCTDRCEQEFAVYLTHRHFRCPRRRWRIFR